MISATIKFHSVLVGAALACALTGCSSNQPEVTRKVELYYPAYRQTPPEPVYSRLTWSHLPEPIRPQPKEKGPPIQPRISFELGDTNLEEAVGALAQTLGYQWQSPPDAATRKVRLKMVGTANEILGEISKQTGVLAEIDHQSRMVKVYTRDSTVPTLPSEARPAL